MINNYANPKSEHDWGNKKRMMHRIYDGKPLALVRFSLLFYHITLICGHYYDIRWWAPEKNLCNGVSFYFVFAFSVFLKGFDFLISWNWYHHDLVVVKIWCFTISYLYLVRMDGWGICINAFGFLIWCSRISINLHFLFLQGLLQGCIQVLLTDWKRLVEFMIG